MIHIQKWIEFGCQFWKLVFWNVRTLQETQWPFKKVIWHIIFAGKKRSSGRGPGVTETAFEGHVTYSRCRQRVPHRLAYHAERRNNLNHILDLLKQHALFPREESAATLTLLSQAQMFPISFTLLLVSTEEWMHKAGILSQWFSWHFEF